MNNCLRKLEHGNLEIPFGRIMARRQSGPESSGAKNGHGRLGPANKVEGCQSENRG